VSAARFAQAGENGRLTVAVPSKGRMLQPTLDLCTAAGLSFETTERALLVPCSNAPVDLLLVRPHDIPEYVQDGVVDAGITGANLVVESQAAVETLAELNFARCSLEAAVPADAPQTVLGDLEGLRVATAYPVSTRASRSVWPTRSSTSSRRVRPRASTACGGSAACSNRRPSCSAAAAASPTSSSSGWR
jgi:hypothetical protein